MIPLLLRRCGRRPPLPRPRLPHLVQRHRHVQDRRRAPRGGAHRAHRSADGGDRRAVSRADPLRGRRNEPALVVQTAAVIAEVRGETLAQVASATSEHATAVPFCAHGAGDPRSAGGGASARQPLARVVRARRVWSAATPLAGPVRATAVTPAALRPGCTALRAPAAAAAPDAGGCRCARRRR